MKYEKTNLLSTFALFQKNINYELIGAKVIGFGEGKCLD